MQLHCVMLQPLTMPIACSFSNSENRGIFNLRSLSVFLHDLTLHCLILYSDMIFAAIEKVNLPQKDMLFLVLYMANEISVFILVCNYW